MISLRYWDKGTGIHKLNPFTKLAWLTSIFVLALIINHPLYLLLLFLATLPAVVAARVWRQWLISIRLALYLSLIIVLINAIVGNYGSHILYQVPFRLPVMGIPTITLEAMVFGSGMALRLLVLISAFALINLTVHPDDMMLAMIKLRLPYKSVLVTSLSTRFIPTLIDDTERIRDVQRSRGLELDKGRLVPRVRNYSAIIVPLLSNSLDRAVQVAEAMESRAFGAGTRRTCYREIKLSGLDAWSLVGSILPLILGILMWRQGYGSYQYYPRLGEISFDALELSLLAVLVCSVSSIVLWGFIKKRLDVD
ncbi:MAG: energy-coupling factor transporter transmembrane protein EcfT [Chloroflexi bacterium]|nr:energy-coupling factor transporter transmembrane protein EcfT [Chloroflexota bacterium]